MKNYYGLTGIKLQIMIGAIAGIDFLLLGYDQGVMGGLLTFSTFKEQFPEINYYNEPMGSSERGNKSTYQGITVGSYTLGCFFGAVATIFLGNVLGRRKTIFTGTTIMTVGAILQCTSFQLGQLIAARLITGFGNGLNSSTVPMWQSETSKSHRRGMMVMIEGALITCGVMISYWIDFGFSFVAGSSVSWRFPLAFQVVFCLIILAFVMGLPESPRWLILKGRDDEAREVLASLSEGEKDDVYVKNEFTAIKDTVLEMSKSSFADLFTMDENRNFHRASLAFWIQVFQQISGINVITYYAATIYKDNIGLSGYLPTLLAALNGTEYFLASWVAVFTIEKVGRRKLMIFGGIGQALTMAALAGTTWNPNNANLGIGAAVLLFVFNSFFAIGWLGMTWLYPAEIVPLRIRAPANALSTSGNWIFNFCIVMITPIAFASIAYKTYIIFAVINAAIVPCVYFFYPETAYRSLEEMDSIFHKTTSIFNAVKRAKDEPRRYGKKGELLIHYEDTEDAVIAERRRSSVLGTGRKSSKGSRASGAGDERFEDAEEEKIDTNEL